MYCERIQHIVYLITGKMISINFAEDEAERIWSAIVNYVKLMSVKDLEGGDKFD